MFKLSSKIPMMSGQHHNDADKEEVEGGQDQDDRVLPLQEKGVFLLLTPLLSPHPVLLLPRIDLF